VTVSGFINKISILNRFRDPEVNITTLIILVGKRDM